MLCKILSRWEKEKIALSDGHLENGGIPLALAALKKN
jgi:hypothetical protein